MNMSLGKLGRKVHLTQRALVQVLKELESWEELPTASRRTLKRARAAETASCSTSAFGNVMQDFTFRRENGEEVQIPVLHPAAMLTYVCQRSSAFADFLAGRLAQHPSSVHRPWRLILYSDEVSPGNQLKHHNARKTQTIYYSWFELGPQALSADIMWFTLTCVRSSVVNSIGGMTALFRQISDLFCQAPNFSLGLPLTLHGQAGNVMFFSRISCMISDEAALKAALANKGATGLVFCCLCQNALDHKSALAEADGAQGMVSSLETDISRFRRNTPESIRQSLRLLQDAATRHPQGYVERLQTALGLNLRPDGLLAHPAFGPDVISTITFDWFHIYVVHGIANLHTGLLLGDLHNHGWGNAQIEAFVEGFQWPARLRGAAPKGLLKKRGSLHEPLKGSASENLNFIILLRVFLTSFVMPECPGSLRQSCTAWLQLAVVLDLLLRVNDGTVTARTLQDNIKRHLDLMLRLYGPDDCWIPKCHLALHLAQHLEKHGLLLSCFVHERKHKIVKKVANHIMDHSRAFEKSILEDILFAHVEQLDDARLMPNSTVHLLDPLRRAPPSVREAFGIPAAEEAWMSTDAIHGGRYSVAKNDVAVAQYQGQKLVGKVQYHIKIWGQCFTCMSMFTHVHGCMFKTMNGDMRVLETSCITATCPYSIHGEDALVVLP